MFGSLDQSRAFWFGVALVLAGVLVFVLHAFVGTFVLGLFLYYAARPIYVRLQERVRPPSLAAAVALFLLVLPVILLFWYTVALGLGQLRTLEQLDMAAQDELLAPYAEMLGVTEELRTSFQALVANPQQLLSDGRFRDVAMDIASTLAAYLGVVLTGVVHLFVAAALAFYLLRDGDRLSKWIRSTFRDDMLITYGRAVDDDLKTVFFGNILNALLTGTIGAAVFSILAAFAPAPVPLPVPILLGLLAGVGSLVPVIGMKIVYVPVAIYLAGLALLAGPQFLWFPILFFVITLLVVDTIPDLVIRPYVSGRNLHVGAVMFAYIFGPLLFGWYGIFLGPLLLVIITDFAVVVVPGLVGSDRPARSGPATDPVDPDPEPTAGDRDAGQPDETVEDDTSPPADEFDSESSPE
jgi:predicted PurR-regulated permease PerM